MYHPTLAAVALGEDMTFTLGLVTVIVVLALALGESRWQVSHLREWARTVEAEAKAMAERIAALEIREGRTLQRLDDLASRLDRMDAKLDKLLERRESA